MHLEESDCNYNYDNNHDDGWYYWMIYQSLSLIEQEEVPKPVEEIPKVFYYLYSQWIFRL